MLDSLGSTLTKSTVNAFWERYGRDPETEALKVDQVIVCLEKELGREKSEKKRIYHTQERSDTLDGVEAAPILMARDKDGGRKCKDIFHIA